MNENQDKLRAAFAESLMIDGSLVVDSLKYRDIPQWDSVAHMALVAALEDKFDVMIDTEEVIDLSSVAKAKEILGKHGVAF
jgi:acyl carrier protein